MLDLKAIRARDDADIQVLPLREKLAEGTADSELTNAIHMVRDRARPLEGGARWRSE